MRRRTESPSGRGGASSTSIALASASLLGCLALLARSFRGDGLGFVDPSSSSSSSSSADVVGWGSSSSADVALSASTADKFVVAPGAKAKARDGRNVPAENPGETPGLSLGDGEVDVGCGGYPAFLRLRASAGIEAPASYRPGDVVYVRHSSSVKEDAIRVGVASEVARAKVVRVAARGEKNNATTGAEDGADNDKSAFVYDLIIFATNRIRMGRGIDGDQILGLASPRKDAAVGDVVFAASRSRRGWRGADVTAVRLQQDYNDGNDATLLFDVRYRGTDETEEGLESKRVFTRRDMGGHVYSRARTDRSGSAIKEALDELRLARSYGLTYCGSCGRTDFAPAHRRLVDALGLGDDLPFWDECPDGAVLRNAMGMVGDEGFERRWLDEMKEKVQAHVVPRRRGEETEDRPYKIVAHVRRGDLDPNSGRFRKHEASKYLPNAYYLALIDRFWRPGARVIVHTEEAYDVDRIGDGGSNGDGTSLTATSEGNDAFRERNYTVAVGGDEGRAWADFVDCDLFVGSKSSFSEVPARFSRGTVVFPSDYGAPLPGWIVVPTKPTCHFRLKECEEAADDEEEDWDNFALPEEFLRSDPRTLVEKARGGS